MRSAEDAVGRDPGPVCALGRDLWFRRDIDGSYVIGLTEAAQHRMGPIAYYRGPVAGRRYGAMEPALSLESAKWVGHLSLPASGTVVDTNGALETDPSPINRDPYGDGWLYRMRPEDPGALEARGRRERTGRG